MPRPDLTTLACVNAECQYVGRPGQGNRAIRKVCGKDGIRLLQGWKIRVRLVFLNVSWYSSWVPLESSHMVAFARRWLMPRQPRYPIPDIPQHVIQRGNNR
jgi:hypothetical protein